MVFGNDETTNVGALRVPYSVRAAQVPGASLQDVYFAKFVVTYGVVVEQFAFDIGEAIAGPNFICIGINWFDVNEFRPGRIITGGDCFCCVVNQIQSFVTIVPRRVNRNWRKAISHALSSPISQKIVICHCVPLGLATTLLNVKSAALNLMKALVL